MSAIITPYVCSLPSLDTGSAEARAEHRTGDIVQARQELELEPMRNEAFHRHRQPHQDLSSPESSNSLTSHSRKSQQNTKRTESKSKTGCSVCSWIPTHSLHPSQAKCYRPAVRDALSATARCRPAGIVERVGVKVQVIIPEICNLSSPLPWIFHIFKCVSTRPLVGILLDIL
jgi:hypothetical protein